MGIFFILVNKLISSIGSALLTFVQLLPASPFTWNFSSIDNQYLKFFAWFMPIPQMVSFIGTWVTAVAIYYGLRIVLRWMKVAGS
jgi:hypothetical protein